jgi:hypothetical protein
METATKLTMRASYTPFKGRRTVNMLVLRTQVECRLSRQLRSRYL